MSEDTAPEMRIGHAERAAALTALEEHFAAGRLDVTEFGDRSAAAGAATVASDLTVLFRDLPAPHPGPAGPPAGAGAPGTELAQRHGGPPERRWSDAVGVLIPVLVVLGVLALTVFGHGFGFLLFPAIFLLAGRFGPRHHE